MVSEMSLFGEESFGLGEAEEVIPGHHGNRSDSEEEFLDDPDEGENRPGPVDADGDEDKEGGLFLRNITVSMKVHDASFS